VFARCAGRSVRRIVATSGTMLNLIAIAAHQRGVPPPPQLNNFAVAAEEIAKVRRLLVKANREERLRIEGLDNKRVDLIVAGACLADYVLREVQAKEMVACTWALREGVVLDFIARHLKGIEETERFTEPRHRSVARFARHLGEIGTHGAHVAQLALQLFDQLQSDLSLPAEAREWLEFASLLHDIGHHIGHKDHQRHAYYLITNGELLGFRPEELEIIGQIARYHCKAPPKDSDPGYAALPKGTRRTVRALSALLRIADGLDRSHYGVVREVTATRRGNRLVLSLRTEGDDPELEIWEARRRAGLLENVLDVEVDFRSMVVDQDVYADRIASVSR
jgi:exopolyphosphatase/guanosine-5'-triphosphate,3'-diphosphate pyrophosphatase